ncbi:pectinesterase 3-like [Coffea arabica]|uniref:Pectinesterase n=1 Tax=Coffea arabica TaxID=13443 RepID=A0A6P6XAY7_COFAR
MMDTIKSFKGYGKVDPVEEQAFRRKTRRRTVILLVSLLLLVALIVGVVVATVTHKKKNSKGNANDAPTSPSQSLRAICSVTVHPDSCYTSISSLEASNSTTDPEKLFQLSLQVVHASLQKLSTLPQHWISDARDLPLKKALGVCQAVIDDAVDATDESLSSLNVSEGDRLLTVDRVNDLKTWLSASLTDLETCLDSLEEVNATVLAEQVRTSSRNSTEFASNSLAIVSKLLTILSGFKIPVHRKLLAAGTDSDGGFPRWVRAADRRLLQTPNENTKPDLVVAQDGSGDYRTISEAVAKIPKKSKTRFVIYVKAGVYKEKVSLDKSTWNVMMYGDGKAKTIVTSDDNFVDGTPTFDTATFAVAGKGFIAKSMAFRNTAGAAKHQAVAFRSGSDQSVLYLCSFDAFQDTLYPHSNRQFYRECDISGTIDFIFGNAAVVFQNCNIRPRQPLPNQFVTITAQGKKDPNQNTGITIQNCVMSPLDKLTAPTYLGRPWKPYSTTVILQTNIGAFLAPKGWIEWVFNVEPPSTIFYGEYQNTGPGSSVAQRVKWAGFNPSLTATQASKYTVKSFIAGQSWIPASAVTFT